MKKLSIVLALFTASMFSLFFLSATAIAGEGPMKLPEKAKTYILELEKFIGAKVSSISTSPERNDTILLENPFKI